MYFGMLSTGCESATFLQRGSPDPLLPPLGSPTYYKRLTCEALVLSGKEILDVVRSANAFETLLGRRNTRLRL
jgi:hypothetical protein